MFWKFNLLTSQIDTLLDQEEVTPGSVTLEDVLDEDDVLQECKGQNKKLLDFLTRPESMVKLVNFVVEEPSDDKDEKVRFKYPNISCELLTSDVPIITDKLSDDENLLKKVYSFLENEDVLNPLQASFFSKVMGLLITRKSELMIEFIKSQENFVSHLVRHIGTSAIMDLLLRLITCIESSETRNACITWLNEQNIIQKLVGLVDPSHTDEEHCNASQSLCDIIRISRDQMSHMQERADVDPLLAAIESQDVVSSLLDHMFTSETKVESVLVNGLQVIQTLLEFRKLGPEGLIEQMTPLDSERLTQGVNNTISAISPRLKDLHELLLNPPKQHYHTMNTTVGCLEPPLGNTRLQVVRLVTSLLITNSHHINVELVNLGTVGIIIDLFFKYGYNNFLHTQVEQCLCTVLNMCPVDDGQGVHLHPLLDQLFSELRFLERILDAWEENENNKSRPGAQRPGYMGHLTQLANHIGECCEKGHNAERIKNTYKEYPEKLQERWEGFVSGTLAELNKTNTADLVGSLGLHSSSDSEDPDFSSIAFPQESAMQQAFSDYQLQQMTSTFIDQFGFNEDEFAEQEERVDAPFTDRISSINFEMNADDASNAATLFEQACNEKMQQFDDPDSDEDLWEDKEITFTKNNERQDRESHRQSKPQERSSRRASDDDDEDDQNSEGSTDSDEELSSPRKIYQVPSSSSAVSTTPTSVTTTTTARPVDAMDVDSSDAWADFSKIGSSPDAMDAVSSPWDQQQQQLPQSSTTTGNDTTTCNTGQNWAKFPTSSDDKSDSKEAVAGQPQQDGNNWADFTKFEDMESSDKTTKPDEATAERSVSPVAMDTNETPASSNRMAQYMVSSGAADSSQQPTSSSMGEDDLSPPCTPRQAWDTPRDNEPSPSTPRDATPSSPPAVDSSTPPSCQPPQEQMPSSSSSVTMPTSPVPGRSDDVPEESISSTNENPVSSAQSLQGRPVESQSPATQPSSQGQSPDTMQTAANQSNDGSTYFTSSKTVNSCRTITATATTTSTCVDTGISMIDVAQETTPIITDTSSNQSPRHQANAEVTSPSPDSCIQGCSAVCRSISSSSGLRDLSIKGSGKTPAQSGKVDSSSLGGGSSVVKHSSLFSQDEEQDDDLSDNFNFLESSGLMKEETNTNATDDATAASSSNTDVKERLSGGEGDIEVTSSSSACSNTNETDSQQSHNDPAVVVNSADADSSSVEIGKLEEVRAQAKQVSTTSSSPNSCQNGPV